MLDLMGISHRFGFLIYPLKYNQQRTNRVVLRILLVADCWTTLEQAYYLQSCVSNVVANTDFDNKLLSPQGFSKPFPSANIYDQNLILLSKQEHQHLQSEDA